MSWTLTLQDGTVVAVVAESHLRDAEERADRWRAAAELAEQAERPGGASEHLAVLRREVEAAQRDRDAAWEAYRDLASTVLGPDGPLSGLDPDREWMRRHWEKSVRQWKAWKEKADG